MISDERERASARRRAPASDLAAPVRRELAPAPPSLSDGEPSIRFVVRVGGYATEIASGEDWFILAQHLGQPQADELELWAEDREAAILLAFAPSWPGGQLVQIEIGNGGGASVDTGAAPDLNQYREAMGESPRPHGPSGPVTKGGS